MLTQEILARVRKIEIRTRRIVDELTGGAYHSVFKGKGMEFDEVREYLPGDDVRTIDWNVTARMGHPFIKKYVEERELTVFLLVDVSASGDFGSGSQRKIDLSAELTALLAFNAIRNNDQVGLLLFTNTNELHLPPRKGRRHVLRVIRELIAYERKNRQTNIRNALETFMRVSHRRAVVFLISDFLDNDYQQALMIANKRHDIIAIRILDKRELHLPPSGYLNIEDAETGVVLSVPGSERNFCRDYALFSIEERQETAEICRRSGVDLIDITTDEDYVKPLMQFFQSRVQRH